LAILEPGEFALKLAADMLNDPAFPSDPQAVAEHYDWPARRLDPAMAHLRELDAARLFDAMALVPSSPLKLAAARHEAVREEPELIHGARFRSVSAVSPWRSKNSPAASFSSPAKRSTPSRRGPQLCSEGIHSGLHDVRLSAFQKPGHDRIGELESAGPLFGQGS
jgi:hypothetical protein